MPVFTVLLSFFLFLVSQISLHECLVVADNAYRIMSVIFFTPVPRVQIGYLGTLMN